MSANSRISRDLIRWLVWLFLGWTYWLGSSHAPTPEKRALPAARCPRCGGALVLLAMTLPGFGVLPLHARPYLDSG
jgi:hypothetical protein